MSVQKILVPVDFSEVTKVVVDTAALIAQKSSLTVTLFHVENNKPSTDTTDKANAIIKEAKEKWQVEFQFILKQGNIFDEITKAASDDQYKFMIIGSHGYKGLREKVFGADILKLLKNTPIPVLSVQKNFKLSENGFESILFPAGSHNTFMHQIKTTIIFARIFESEVHLYSVEKPGIAWSDELKTNIAVAQAEFERNNISFKKVKETQNTFSVGYAKQIMDYAKRENVSLIAIMANPTKEHYYIADSDKVAMLTNEACIPVLSCNDKTML